MLAKLMLAFRMTMGTISPPQEVPPPPPPPPPPAEKPKPPAPIRVGGDVQQALLILYMPGARWVNPVSAERLQRSRQAVESDPWDVCSRGDLVSHLDTDERFEHLLWMIENHPEWDGFYLPYPRNRPTLNTKHPRYDEQRHAWLRAVKDEPDHPIVLYNAASFFTVTEPERAMILLKRALELEPGEPLFLRGLGLVYGYAQVESLHPSPEFARYARMELQDSEEPLLLGVAWEPFWNWDCRMMASCGHKPPSFMLQLQQRPLSLERERSYLEPALPQPSRYTQSSCPNLDMPRRQ